MRPSRHVQHLGTGLQRLGRLGGGEEIVRPGGDPRHEIPGQQGRHQPDAVALHQANGLGVQIGAVLDRVAPGAQEAVDPVRAVGVGRDLPPHAMRRPDNGTQFLVRELLAQTRRRVRQHAAGGRDLDDVGPGPHLGTHRPHAIVDARAHALGRQQVHDVLAVAVDVAVTAMDGHRRAGRDDARSRNVAAADGVAQGKDRLVRPAQIGHGGEAGHQGAAGVARTDHRLFGIGLGDLFQPPVRVLLAGQVNMAVDQARQHERVAQIDDPAFADKAVANFNDLVPSDHESFIALHNARRRIGQKPTDLHERRSLCRRNGRASGRLGRNACGHKDGGDRQQTCDRLHETLPGTDPHLRPPHAFAKAPVDVPVTN